MQQFVMLTRLAPGALRTPRELEDLERRMMEQVRVECPDVEWVQNLAVFGPYDYLDIFTAPDMEVAARVSTLVRVYGHAHTELWPATEWRRFKEVIRDMSGPES